MQMLTPSAQNGAEGLQTVEETQQNSEALFDGPDAALWVGFGAFVSIFLVVILMIIRSRVIGPARRKQVDSNFFEPAGEDAEITFDDSGEETPAPREKKKRWGKKKDKIKADPVAQPVKEEFEDTAEITIERSSASSDAADISPEISIDDMPELKDRQAEPKKSRSPFANLFSRKKDTAKDRIEPVDEDHHDDLSGITVEHSDQESDIDILDGNPAEPNPFATRLRQLDDDVEHRRRAADEAEQHRLAEAEEARQHAALEIEQARRDAEEEAERFRQEARDEAAREAEFERRKRDAAFEQRFQSMSVMEQSLAEKSDHLKADAEAVQRHLEAGMEERFADLSDQLNLRIAGLEGVSAQDNTNPAAANFAGLTDVIASQINGLRSSMQASLDTLAQRMDKLGAAPEGASGLSRQIADLNKILGGRAAGATAGRVQLSDLVRSALPPDRYEFSKKLSNNRTADCIVTMPGGLAPIAIDARFPVDAFGQYLRQRSEPGHEIQAENDYRRAVVRHIVDIAENLIVRGETAESALMFVPSESISSDLHENLPDLVQDSYRARVWVVSPTSLMATLHTVSAVLSNAHHQDENFSGNAPKMMAELDALRQRVSALEDELQRAENDHKITAAAYQDILTVDNNPHTNDFAEDDNFTRTPPAEHSATVSTAEGPETPALSPEEEAFERLEREEARAANPTGTEPPARPPFPLR